MAFAYTNKTDISLPLTVFLLRDGYDYDSRENSVSATGLIRPLRQLVLSQQNKDLQKSVDISELIASRMGTALHDAFERSWKDLPNVVTAMQMHNIPESAIRKIRVNPEKLEPGDIPVYMEQRSEREMDGFIITGKYDLIMDGILSDLKSTSCWSYIYDSNADNYTKQGSIYKWLNPDKITADYVNIQYIFTDWSAVKARQDKQYPQQRMLTKKYPLWTIDETENWIKNKLAQFTQLQHLPQSALPECTDGRNGTDDELWASETVYKYYKNPAKTSRATKNFPTMDEALARKANDGDVGVIKTVPGEVKACRYCPVVGICDYSKQLVEEGRLML